MGAGARQAATIGALVWMNGPAQWRTASTPSSSRRRPLRIVQGEGAALEAELRASRPIASALRPARMGVTLQMLSGGHLAGSTIEVALELPEGHTVELEQTERVPLGLNVGTGYLAVYTTLVLPALLVMPFWGSIPSLRPLRVAVKLLGLHLYALPLAYVLRDRPWAWAIQPLITILTVRDELLVDGIRRMLAAHPAAPAVVIVGRAHVPGVVDRLLEHGFRRVEGRVQGLLAAEG